MSFDRKAYMKEYRQRDYVRQKSKKYQKRYFTPEINRKYRNKYKTKRRAYAKFWQEQNKNYVKLYSKLHPRSQTYRDRKQKIVEYLGGKCKDCGIKGPACIYDCHHLDPSKKDVGIAKISGRKWETIEKELAKCILLCANCHRIRHGSRNNS